MIIIPTMRGVLAARRREIGGSMVWDAASKHPSVTLTNSNWTMTSAAASYVSAATVQNITSKKYAEVKIDALGTGCMVGIVNNGYVASGAIPTHTPHGYGYRFDGSLMYNGGVSATWATFTTGDVIGVAVDEVVARLFFSVNGIWQGGNPNNGTGGLGYGSGPFRIAAAVQGGGALTINSKAAALAYPPPTGFTPVG